MQIEKNADGKVTRFTMLKPFDGHQHLRQGEMLKVVAPMVAKRFAGAIIMPNTQPPITNGNMVSKYMAEIADVTLPVNTGFIPRMTCYLTDTLDPREVALMASLGHICGVKYYPRGLTTNSDSGVADPASLWTPGTNAYNVLRVLAEAGGVLLLHAADGFARSDVKVGDREYRAGDELDPYDQEQHFIENTLPRIIETHPKLKISVEHLSTKWGARFMALNGGGNLGCSITAHHLLLDRRDAFRSGVQVHKHWWPIIQAVEHRRALQGLVWNHLPYVWLGSDSAPHPVSKKEAACCVGGVLTAHAAVELYTEAFDDALCLDNRFEEFASINGPNFYGIQPSEETITLIREDSMVINPYMIATEKGMEPVVPFRLGEKIRWKLAD